MRRDVKIKNNNNNNKKNNPHSPQISSYREGTHTPRGHFHSNESSSNLEQNLSAVKLTVIIAHVTML